MRRRSLLQLGAVGGGLLALAGLGVAWWTPGWQAGRLSPSARALMGAVARAVLAGVLPADPAVQRIALDAHLLRLEATIAGLPPATRRELSDLLAVLCSPPGRLALVGLRPDWPAASAAELQQALQHLRTADGAVRRQVYQALRELTNAAWFADAGSWVWLGYPGPTTI